MRIRVAHLSNYYKKLERDIEEIQNLQRNMSRDRSYSLRLANSLQEEAERISLLQKKIYSQIIKDAPASLVKEFGEKTGKSKEQGRGKEKGDRSGKAGEYEWPQEPVISIPSSFEKTQEGFPSIKSQSQKAQRGIFAGQKAPIKSTEAKVSKKEKGEGYKQENKKASFPFLFKKD